MVEHTCINDERIRSLEVRVTAVETKVDGIKEDLAEIKNFQSRLLLGIIGTLTSSVVTLIVLIVNVLKG